MLSCSSEAVLQQGSCYIQLSRLPPCLSHAPVHTTPCRQKTVDVKAYCECGEFWCSNCLNDRHGENINEVPVLFGGGRDERHIALDRLNTLPCAFTRLHSTCGGHRLPALGLNLLCQCLLCCRQVLPLCAKGEWFCPLCRDLCNCSRKDCLRVCRNLQATGQLIHEARKLGYRSVRLLVVPLKTTVGRTVVAVVGVVPEHQGRWYRPHHCCYQHVLDLRLH